MTHFLWLYFGLFGFIIAMEGVFRHLLIRRKTMSHKTFTRTFVIILLLLAGFAIPVSAKAGGAVAARILSNRTRRLTRLRRPAAPPLLPFTLPTPESAITCISVKSSRFPTRTARTAHQQSHWRSGQLHSELSNLCNCPLGYSNCYQGNCAPSYYNCSQGECAQNYYNCNQKQLCSDQLERDNVCCAVWGYFR